ncbi:hypothetical protein AGMMS49593_06280 [Endomicrobiia bacterium]|nr:hypothetical protein AGMMS49593_06280 [Endomicrobiia bacterium]
MTYDLKKDAYIIHKVVKEIREIPTTNIYDSDIFFRVNKDEFTRYLIENLATEVDHVAKETKSLVGKTIKALKELVAKTAVAGSVQDLKDKETK